jgi:LysM repeat protein
MRRIVLGVLICAVLFLTGSQSAYANPPALDPTFHIVQWGENLTGIARQYGTTIQAIVQANHLVNANRIYAGQRLVIPGAWTPPPASSGTYVVQRGDTLAAIAYRHGVSVTDLVRANGIVNPNRIYPGQRLLIPGSSGTPPTPPSTGTYYAVQRGDTLAKIAMRFQVSIWAIVQANNIANPNIISSGQRLYIPAASTDIGSVKPGCEHLSWPCEGSKLSGVVPAWGTADLANFYSYRLEYRKDGENEWHRIASVNKPVRSDILGAWDTRTVSDGRYVFRLVIVDRTGSYPPPCEITVDVKNTP